MIQSSTVADQSAIVVAQLQWLLPLLVAMLAVFVGPLIQGSGPKFV